MSRLLVTADVHGSYGTWMLLKSLLKPGDTLVVAGDLFDTRYGRPGHPDYQPETIKNDLATLGNRFCYVYGNCDIPSFYPGYAFDLQFSHMGKKIHLVHGHTPVSGIPSGTAMVIQGHTHIPRLEKQENLVMFNPGSLAAPRTERYTYGIVDNNRISLMDLKQNRALACLDL
ncbi:MAG: YfcE family phosphodiesterase [Desulfobacterium sp.]|nr:YfcE family phosphodiesterase [Desulfobacterium sp.]